MSDILQTATFQFESTAENGAWQVLLVDLDESVGEPYALRVRLAQPEADAGDLSAFNGADCVLITQRGTTIERRHCGLCTRATFAGVKNREVNAVLEIRPALHALSQRVDSRMFQEKTGLEIVKAVLEKAFGDYGREVDDSGIKRTLPKREYTVQYRESDLDFVHRLLEEEGISYAFDHAGDVEKMVLFDANDVLPPCETIDGADIVIADQNRGGLPAETIESFTWSSHLQPTSVVVRDHDWTRPALDLTKEARGEDAAGKDRELYESGVVTTIGEYKPKAYSKDDAKEQSTLRKEAATAAQLIGLGKSNVISMRAGVLIKLAGHAMTSLDDEYLVTRVVHRGLGDTDGAGTETRLGREPYENEFTCIPGKVPYRAQRRRREPRVLGAETATVVGPAGEEIYTDEHGRIKVQFHWDREGKKDEKSSCWIRVAQAWAGAGFGTVFVPRIGMEVIVHFLDGHPDRPLVTGVVYNGKNPPAYALPGEKTKSTLYSESSMGGGGHNEFTFEDAKGSEVIYVHGQKDWNTDVLNDMNTWIGANQNIDVASNRTKHVGGDQTQTVDGNDETTISGTRKLTLTGNDTSTISGNRTLTLSGNDDTTVGGNRTVAISGNDTLSVSGNVTTGTSGSETLTVGGSMTETIGGGHTFHMAVIGALADHFIGSYAQKVSGQINEAFGGTVEVKTDGINIGWTCGAYSSLRAGAAGEVYCGINHSLNHSTTKQLNAGLTVLSSGTKLVGGMKSETTNSTWHGPGIKFYAKAAVLNVLPAGVEFAVNDITVKDDLYIDGDTTIMKNVKWAKKVKGKKAKIDP